MKNKAGQRVVMGRLEETTTAGQWSLRREMRATHRQTGDIQRETICDRQSYKGPEGCRLCASS